MGLKRITIDAHLRHIKRYLEYCIGANLDTEEPSSIRQFLSLVKEKWKTNTYSNHVKSLRVFCAKYLKSDIAKSFKIPRPQLPYVQVPTKEELRRFFNELPSWREKALFLMYASSGRRRDELLYLNKEDVDFEQRMLAPFDKESQTKNVWFSFFNEEASEAYQQYQAEAGDRLDGKLFEGTSHINQIFRETSKRVGVRITPQILREWFCQQMGELGTADRFTDAFCGRVPSSVLGTRYTDYRPEKLKEIYLKANLKVLA